MIRLRINGFGPPIIYVLLWRVTGTIYGIERRAAMNAVMNMWALQV